MCACLVDDSLSDEHIPKQQYKAVSRDTVIQVYTVDFTKVAQSCIETIQGQMNTGYTVVECLTASATVLGHATTWLGTLFE